jgi:tetratricopeptide (TPR) repeat protein
MDEAIAAYDKALEITPGYLIALANKGDALRRLTRKPDALACFEAVLAQRPKDSRALGARAELLDELGRTEEAVPAYETWLEIAKLSPAEARRVRERINALKPKPAAAEAAELAPIPEAVVPKVLWTQPPPDCQKKGEIALAQGQPAKALEWFDQSIAGDPRNYNAWGGKADALFALKRHLESVAHAAKALEINPRFVAGWQRKAQALEAAGRLEQALEAWDKGVLTSARNIQLWNGRGQTLIALRRDAEAVASFDQALAVDARFSVARYNKALAEERLGRLEDAVRSYQQFIALAPPHLASQVQEARRKIQELGPS